MAYTIADGSVLECQARCIIAQQQCINVFHYEYIGTTIADGNAAALGFANAFREMFCDQITNIQSDDIYGMIATAQWVHPTRYVGQQAAAGQGQGQIATRAVPSGAAMVIRRRSERANRSSRGRIYVPGIPAADIADSQLGSAFIAANRAQLEGFMTAFLDVDGIPGTCYPIVWSYSDRTHKDRVVSGNLDTVIRYQRRREVGRGI